VILWRLLSIPSAPSSIDYTSAISWSRNFLDRLSPLSVLTVEFQVHRQVRRALSLAYAFLSGVLLRFVGDPSRDVAANAYIDSAFAISWSWNVLDRLSPLSVLTVEFHVHR
jgi:hypothetical protein